MIAVLQGRVNQVFRKIFGFFPAGHAMLPLAHAGMV